MRFRVIAILCFTVFFSTPVQSYTGKTTLQVNREYGGIHTVAVPHEFSISFDEKSTHVVYPDKLGDSSSYFKLQFVNDANELKENMTLKYVKIPMLDESTRFVEAKRLLLDQLNSITSAQLIGADEIKINHYKGIIVNAQNGPYYLSLLAILNPNSQHCIMALINIDPKFSDVKNIDGLGEYIATPFHVLGTFSFGRELM